MAGPVLPDGCDVAASFLSRCRGSRNFRLCRCGDFGLVSRHKPAEHRFLIFPLLPTLRRRVSHAEERLRHQRFFTCRGAAAKSTPLTLRGAAGRSTPLRPSVVASMSWPDRGHHVPALTVTSGGRGVGSDEACSGRLVVLRQQVVFVAFPCRQLIHTQLHASPCSLTSASEVQILHPERTSIPVDVRSSYFNCRVRRSA